MGDQRIAMAELVVAMPDGTRFQFWDDNTEYSHVYHVACQHPEASDEGPGTEDKPFATINRAAQVLEPAEKVVVHGGVYWECVRPARGGESEERMIAYEVAAGEEVHVRGSELWTPEWEVMASHPPSLDCRENIRHRSGSCT